MSIDGLSAWQTSPQGSYVLGWVQQQCVHHVVDVFGFNALQIGLPSLDLLSVNRIPLRMKIDTEGSADLCCHLTELPIASQSIDLVVLPFVLDFDANPHQVLREIERVLRPEGQLLIIGFNPWSLWGFWRWVNRLPYPLVQRPRSFPWNGKYLSISRLRDWLQLLSFEVDRGAFGCYIPPLGSEKMLGRLSFLEPAGDRWWRGAGGTYLLRAVKRVKGMRLMPPWATVTAVSGQRVLKPGLTGATGLRQEGKSE